MPAISMAKIEGRLSARRVFQDAQKLFPLIPDDSHSVDMCAFTTSGLYATLPAHDRQKARKKLSKFLKDFKHVIAFEAGMDSSIVPTAWRSKNWDQILEDVRFIDAFIQNYGRLKNLSQANTPYREALVQIIDKLNLALTPEQISFFNEEFAFTSLIVEKKIYFPKDDLNLRHDNDGPVYIMYPAAPLQAEMEALRGLGLHKRLNRGQAFFIDSSDEKSPRIYDYAEMIDQLSHGIDLASHKFQPVFGS